MTAAELEIGDIAELRFDAGDRMHLQLRFLVLGDAKETRFYRPFPGDKHVLFLNGSRRGFMYRDDRVELIVRP